ncbi:MAG: acyl carrier protein [Chloroflexota bacterium]|nr:acyl carrier protein [Chloroflexota bacterium]
MSGAEQLDTGVREELRHFIEQNFLYMRPDYRLDDEDDLLKLGVIDSLGFVELVDEVQTRYGIDVQDVEITEENFGSVGALVRFIARRATP